MVERKFNKVLTVILVIIIIAILVALGFWIYDLIQRNTINSGANEVVKEFDKKISELNTAPVQNIVQNPQTNNTPEQQERNENNQSTTTYTTPSNQIELKYKGFDVVGKIEIPATDLNYPILSVATATSMNASVGVIYGPGPNKIGNTVIMGHNYRNGTFFSDNDDLKNGDDIYITDLSGQRIRYIVYNKYYTTSTDFEYGTRETAGRREITLESCTDDAKSRVIVWAKED